MREAAARYGIGLKVAVAGGSVLGPLGVGSVPSTVFVSKDGVIVAAANGPRSARFFEARVKDLLEP